MCTDFRRTLCTLAVFLCFGFALAGQTISGTVVDRTNGRSIPWILVVALDTEDIAETDENGSFELIGDFNFPLAIRVISDQHQTLDIVLEAFPAGPLRLQLEPLFVDLGTIEAVAQRSAVRTSGAVDSRQIRTTATGNDPFALVDRVPEVINPSQTALDNDFGIARLQLEDALGSSVFSMLNPFHFRGLPYYANAYFISLQMPLFFQYYSFVGVMLSSVVPSPVLAGIDMYGNGRDAAVGPGAGLLSSMRFREPRATFIQEWYLTTLAAGFVLDWGNQDETSGLVLAVRKSLFEFSWIPLVVLLNSRYQWYVPSLSTAKMLNFVLHPGTLDAQLRYYRHFGDTGRLTLDFVNATGYTDFGFELLVGGVSDTKPLFLDMKYRHLNLQTGINLLWEQYHGPEWTLRYGLYDILSWTGRTYIDAWLGGETLRIGYNYPLNDAGLRFSADWRKESFSASFGLTGRLLYGWYERRADADPIMNRRVAEDIPPRKGLETFETASWLKLAYSNSFLEIEPALRLDWYEVVAGDSFLDKLRLSPSLQVYIFPADRHSVHAGVALRHDRFDYITRHMFLSQQGMRVGTPQGEEGIPPDTIDQRYVQTVPARVFSGEVEYSYESAPLVLKVGAYGLTGDQLSGFDFQSFYVSTEGQGGGFLSGSVSQADGGFKAAHRLWSAGVSLTALLQSANKGLDVVYSWGMSRYFVTKKEGQDPVWVVPNSDTAHTVKLYGYYLGSSGWDFGSTLRVHVGIPQTPNQVDAVYTDWDGTRRAVFSPVPDKVNTLRDYMPRFAWDFKISKTFVKPVWWQLYLDVANVFSFPRYAGPAVNEVGFVERKTGDRTYDWTPVKIESFPDMRIDLGVRLKM